MSHRSDVYTSVTTIAEKIGSEPFTTRSVPAINPQRLRQLYLLGYLIRIKKPVGGKHSQPAQYRLNPENPTVQRELAAAEEAAK